MLNFFCSPLLASVIGVTFFQICQTYNDESNFHSITTVVAFPNEVNLKNCTSSIFCIVKSLKKPEIYWISNISGLINNSDIVTVDSGLGNSYVSKLFINECFRNATYTCISSNENHTEMDSTTIILKLKEWECLDESDCKPYRNSVCQNYQCVCINETSCTGKNSPPTINLQPFNNDPTIVPNSCYKHLICKTQGYDTTISWGLIDQGIVKPSDKWHNIYSYRKEHGILISELTILKCRKYATYFCVVANRYGRVSSHYTIRMKLEKFQCWDIDDCRLYDGICRSNICYCKNGQAVSLNNCTVTETIKKFSVEGLSQAETNAIIISTIIGAILITNAIIFIVYRISKKRTKSSAAELTESMRSNKY
ncbi:uncharacterized protein LOC111638146 isoform X1 [Centruroides sculpturatus]|uniref:uncharacterized protein LOC111638146 isoform X1 n=1 Tax=Centruroides sculpturatus TaxID=218467 RepID=UPI000C6EDD10|nr:uncharacterized protein LOC111638146 isoform X1 [Centruroides sculpturatus]